MWRRGKNSGKATVVESALVLALLGILAGAAAGLASNCLAGQEELSPEPWAERNRGDSGEKRRPVGVAGGRLAET